MHILILFPKNRYKPGPLIEHVVLMGNIRESIGPFLDEFLHPDHGVDRSHAVIISSGDPSPEIRRQLENPYISHRITYLDGNIIDEEDLDRACLSTAKAIFIFTNKYSSQPSEEDATSILRSMAIKKYFLKKEKSPVFTCVQLIKAESKKLYSSSVSHNTVLSVTNQTLCIDELKLNLMAKNCIFPGITTMIQNLTRSIAVEASENNPPWKREYLSGCGYEIYRVPLSSALEGLTFGEAAKLIYEESGSLLFAIEISLPDKEPKLFLNPGKFLIRDVKKLLLMGYVIAEDLEAAEIVTNLAPR